MTNEELVAEIQQGINLKENMSHLYMQNKPLISKLIKPYISYAEYDDLMQEAYFGLQKAIEHYTPMKNIKFISYAVYWIISEVARYTYKNSNTKNISISKMQEIYRYKKFLAQYSFLNSELPKDNVICNELKITQGHLNSIRKTIHEMNCMSIYDAMDATFGVYRREQ